MIEYSHQLEEQEDIHELSKEVIDSTTPPNDPKTTASTHSSSNDLGDTTIMSVTCNIWKMCYDVYHNAASIYTLELLHAGKRSVTSGLLGRALLNEGLSWDVESTIEVFVVTRMVSLAGWLMLHMEVSLQ